MSFMKYWMLTGLFVGFLVVPSFGQITRWDTGEVIPGTEDTTIAPGMNLSQWQTADHHLRYADISGADIHDSSFYHVWLDHARFSGSNLRGVLFDGTRLNPSTATYADFSSADLTEAKFSEVVLTGADFSGANITGLEIRFCSGFGTEQLSSTMNYANGNLSNIQFRACQFESLDLSGMQLTGTSFYTSTLTNLSMIGASGENISFASAELPSANLSSGVFTQGDFEYSNLSNANLRNATLIDADFTHANLSGADLSDADIEGAVFNRTPNGSGSGITVAQLTSTASYQNGILHDIGFRGSDLSGCDFSNKDLQGTSFQEVTLTNTVFTNADVRGVSFTATTDKGFTAEQLYATASYQIGDLQGVLLVDNDLTDWDFSHQNLTNASLRGVLTGADFNGAIIRGANIAGTYDNISDGMTNTQLYSTSSYQSGDLAGVRLYHNDLSGCDLSQKNLTSASFFGSDLSGADFSGSQMADADFGSIIGIGIFQNASFRGANLSYVDLGFTDLAYADFTDAIITGIRIGGRTTGFTAEQLYSTANYQSNNLSGIRIVETDLSGWDFSNQNLTDTVFSGSSLEGTNFEGSDLRGSYVYSDALSDAITVNTILSDGTIEGLNLASGMIIRDYAGDIAITIEDEMVLTETGKLSLLFEDIDWGSTITLADTATVDLDGTLYLGITEGANLDILLGTTFRIFNWNQVLPYDEVFADVAWDEGFEWNTNNLYSMGMVTLTGIPEVPEPCTLGLLVLGGSLLARKRRF